MIAGGYITREVRTLPVWVCITCRTTNAPRATACGHCHATKPVTK